MLATIFRHFGRYQEILSVLIRNGFGFILMESMAFGSQSMSRLDPNYLGQRIRRVLEELGPTFIKIGQFASTRPDLIPLPVIRELEKLQDSTPEVPFALIRQTVEEELGAPLQAIFQEFKPVPLASASLGQVHYARLKSGEEVAVKIQRPNLGIIKTDLEILQDVIPILEYRFPGLKNYFLSGILREFAGWLKNEQNYLLEGKNAERMAGNFRRDARVAFPSIHWNYTTRRVLTMSYLAGINLKEFKAHKELKEQKNLKEHRDPKKLKERETFQRYDSGKIAAEISRALLLQVTRDGFFHGDPHPGNILVLPDGRIGFVDFGIVGSLNPELKRSLLKLKTGLSKRDPRIMTKALIRMGVVTKQIQPGVAANQADFRSPELDKELLRLTKAHFDLPIAKLSLQALVDDCMNLAFQCGLELPTEFILLGKSLLTLEGLIHELDPGKSLAELLTPFRRRAVWDFLRRKWPAGRPEAGL